MNPIVRKWWHGYVVSPVGTIAGVVLFAVALAVVDPTRSSLRTILDAGGIAIVGVLISYIVGVMLLPVLVVFDKCGWRGWKVYIPTGAAAGLLTAIGMGGPAQANAPWYFVLAALCGGLCACVFALRVSNFTSDSTTLSLK